MKRPVILIAVLALATSACAGPSVLIAGESMRFPEPPPQMIGLTVLGADDLTPVSASLSALDEIVATDPNGAVELLWEEEPIEITVSADGFYDSTVTVSEKPLEGPVEIRLEPVVLTGTVTAADGRPLPGASIKLGANLETSTDSDGEFTLFRATPGDLVVDRPAWEGAQRAPNRGDGQRDRKPGRKPRGPR